MMRAIVLLTLLSASQATPVATASNKARLPASKVVPAVKVAPVVAKKAAPALAKKAAPLAVKKTAVAKLASKSEDLKLGASKDVPGQVQLSSQQKKTMHWGCVNACKPSPVESKCVTACEAASYRCIDETGPGETAKDTKKCQDGVLKLYKETKGLKKEEKQKDGKKAGKKGGKKDAKKSGKKEKKAEKKKAKSLLRVVRDDDDSLADELSLEAEESTEAEVEADSTSKEESDEDEADKADDEDAEQEESQDAVDEDAAEDDASSTNDENEEEGEQSTSEPDVAFAEEQSLAQVSRSGDDDDSTQETESGSDDEEQSQDGDDSSTTSTEEEVADEGNDEAVADEDDTDEDGEDESLVETHSSWKPEPCGELEPGVPCTHLYEHPQGSTVVMPCPVDQQTNPEACGALFGNKADGEQCSQITCPKALGVTMKLICGGGCCPSCWAPDHVIRLDRHTSIDDAAVVDPAPQAPSTCGGVKCFKTACAAGFTEGFVNGDCCYSCIPGR